MSLTDQIQGTQKEDPEGQSDRREQGGNDYNAGGKNVVTIHIFCHNIGSRSAGRSKHDQQCDQLLIAET